MASSASETYIEKILFEILTNGLTGTVKDFVSWIALETRLKYKEEVKAEDVLVYDLLKLLQAKDVAQPGRFDPKEFTVNPARVPKGSWLLDNYEILGAAKYSPIQYVRSRQEYFLLHNQASEEDVMDISIATIEAIENAVKYGDGQLVRIENSITPQRVFKLTIVNQIKEFDLENEIERGKYSSNITLMRGIMVMQKLFDHLDLQINDASTQATLYAEKKLQ